jgi:hypothetical protein
MSGLCEEMKSRGVNLDWYDKRKHRPTATGPVPLDDAICSRNSIYMIKQDGSLWTVKSDGEAYSKVRELDRVVARDVYVCLSCKAPINVRRSTITRGDRLETLFLLPFPARQRKSDRGGLFRFCWSGTARGDSEGARCQRRTDRQCRPRARLWRFVVHALCQLQGSPNNGAYHL